MENFLKELGLELEGHYNVKNNYIIDIEDSKEYGKIYSKLDKSDLLDENDDSSTITMHNSHIVFESDEYQLTLMADFENDTYKLVCKEI